MITNAVKFLITKAGCDDKILIVQSKYWSLPGGKLEEGEDEYTAAKREMREELNLCFDQLSLYKIDTFKNKGWNNFILHMVLREGNEPIPGAEIIDLRWVSILEACNTIKYWRPYLIKLITKVEVMAENYKCWSCDQEFTKSKAKVWVDDFNKEHVSCPFCGEEV